jgi:arabinan endo-1,5-alpha-L-arabinosidase
MWAPDVVKIGDNYLLYYSLSVWGDPNPGIGVASASHPLGPWTDHGKILDSDSIGVNNSIDATVFVDDQNDVYMIWGSFRGIYGIELSNDGLSLENEDYASDLKVLIAGYDTSFGWNASTYEGAYIVQKDGYYYMFLSSGTCCEGLSSSYNVVVARSTSPLGPYYDDEGRDMLAGNRGYQVVNGSAYFVGTGHNSVIQDDAGDYWILYHAYDTSEDPSFGNSPRRSLMLDKLVWNEEGWPSVHATMPTNRSTLGPIIN